MGRTAADQQSDAPVLSKALAAGAPVDADASAASPRLRALQQLGAQALSIADGDGRPTLELFGR